MLMEDGIEKAIGKFGKYQTFILFLAQFGRMPIDFQLNNVVFVMPSVTYNCLDAGAPNKTNHCPCQNPEYDTSTIVSSVTSEYNLICDRQYLASLAQSMLQIGILFGSIIYGYLSDRFGRKLAVVLALFLNVVFIAASSFVPQLWMFMVCRFLIGTTTGGTMLCCYVLVIELSGTSFRPYLIGLLELSFITSYFVLPIIAYFVREWRYLQLVNSIPWLFVISYYWILPESPRWLITVGRRKEATEILTYIAKKNNRPIENIEKFVDEMENESARKGHHRGSFKDLFKTPKIRVYTIVSSLIWIFCTHTFYGVNQYIGNLQGNIYLNVMVSAASLAPTLVLTVLGAIYLKRRLSIIISFTVAGASLLCFIIIPSGMRVATLVFAMIGQLGAYAAFIQIYLFTSEIFPTVIRNSAMGFSSMLARFGGFMAPFVVNIGIEWVSIIIFSGLAFSAAILSYFLPETKGTTLLNSIEQTEGSTDKSSSISE